MNIFKKINKFWIGVFFLHLLSGYTAPLSSVENPEKEMHLRMLQGDPEAHAQRLEFLRSQCEGQNSADSSEELILKQRKLQVRDLSSDYSSSWYDSDWSSWYDSSWYDSSWYDSDSSYWYDSDWSSSWDIDWSACYDKNEDRTFLFKRKGSVPGDQQIIELSNNIFHKINKHKPKNILFDKEKIAPFDYGGVCTAMALDFLSRYINECSSTFDADAKREAVKSFAPYYRNQNSTFISRQAVYNTISVRVAPITSQEFEDIKWHKMQALANYHDIVLEPVTNSISTSEVRKKIYSLEDEINSLPDGVYFVREISPATNNKMEWFGHSMVFVKGEEFSVFYDNGSGAVEIHMDAAKYASWYLATYWGIPDVKIYRASSLNGSCSNLSDQES